MASNGSESSSFPRHKWGDACSGVSVGTTDREALEAWAHGSPLGMEDGTHGESLLLTQRFGIERGHRRHIQTRGELLPTLP